MTNNNDKPEEIENWKPVPLPSFKHLYEVSDLARVRNRRTGKILSQYKTPSGYMTVSLKYRGERKTCKVHRLVALAFVYNPCPEQRTDVHHLTGKDINKASELVWVSKRENNSIRTLSSQKKSSRFAGVVYNKPLKKWQARLWINKRYVSLGYFSNEVAAHRAYVKALKEHGIQNRFA